MHFFSLVEKIETTNYHISRKKALLALCLQQLYCFFEPFITCRVRTGKNGSNEIHSTQLTMFITFKVTKILFIHQLVLNFTLIVFTTSTDVNALRCRHFIG